MFSLYRPQLAVFAALILLCLCLIASHGQAKPAELWHWPDIVSEGGMALMAGVWMAIVLSSRPAGRVTAVLAVGLAAIALGYWVDLLDEFWKVSPQVAWDNWLESGFTLGGMLTVTAGLWLWRQEQYALSEHLLKRERLFREHRAFDRLTQLANADYLRRQIRLERERLPDAPCALILLDLNDFHRLNQMHGRAEGDRVLQAVSQLLLLNLRNQDLLCRYAGDRFAVLLPDTLPVAAEALAQQLRKVVANCWHHNRAGERLVLSARTVCAVAQNEVEPLLDALNAALDPHPAVATA